MYNKSKIRWLVWQIKAGNERDIWKGIYTVEKRQKNNPNLLALFAFYRYLFIIGSVWGYLYIYHIFAELQNKN